MEVLKVERTIKERGRIVIPKLFLEGLDIKDGDIVIISVIDNGRIELRKKDENSS